MTPEIAAALEKAKTLAEVEDIYRPYKPKRKKMCIRDRSRYFLTPGKLAK